jgi:hypothetical protein
MFGRIGLAGEVSFRVTRRPQKEKKVGWGWKIRNLPNLVRAWRVPLALALGIPTMYGTLHARLRKADGRVIDYGLVSARVVTTAFVNFMVDQLQSDTTEWGDFKYHDSGVGTTAENVTDTGIETTDGESRATGRQTEGASANIYKSVGVISYTTTKAITEGLSHFLGGSAWIAISRLRIAGHLHLRASAGVWLSGESKLT